MNSSQNLLRITIVGLTVVFMTLPASAQQRHVVRHGYALRRGPAVPDYGHAPASHHGMPSSTVAIPTTAGTKMSGKLDQLNRQSVTAVATRPTGANGGSIRGFHLAVNHASDRQAPLNFAYHQPAAGTATGAGARSGMRLRAR
jgi:hypothetical protein